ncbi:MAG: DUF1579 domain-containing protein [Fimbriimonadaceae bacterium]|nr:DUF1579 domain-containing protein [Fimbriimonadaceae bacterium]QYK59025.1 MAG: DUF1579 domain-containing protein [Fimbriimonadaceae bacterium]
MSDTTDNDSMGPTQPTHKHKLLERFLGEWRGESTMFMGPDKPQETAEVQESVHSLGGLFAHIKGETTMPGGFKMVYYSALGYDLTFEEYRGVWYSDVSSHIWTYTCELSPDGNTLSCVCEGPNMDPEVDSLTANYRDVHHFESDSVRTMTSAGLQPDGTWMEFQRVTYTKS